MGSPSDVYITLRSDALRPHAVEDIAKRYRGHRPKWGHTDAIEMVAADLGVSMRTLYRWFEAWPEIEERINKEREEIDA